jgi:sigma-54 dependent transcriptional regulator, acetoin dehydrogenase operon transcriptional activator AcoR
VRLPPLAERREDLGLLVAALLTRLAPERAGKLTLTSDAARSLLQYPWPHHVRELEKVLHAATVLAAGEVLGVEHLPEALLRAAQATPEAEHASRPLTEQEQRHRAELDATLHEARGNVAEAARRLGKGRTQVQRWIERYGLDLTRHRT